MQKENLEFGHGSFVGQVMKDPTFFDLPVREQARVLGWADSCPVVTELTDPSNPNPGRGPEAMLRRYGEVNFWFGFINRAAGEIKPELQRQLLTPVKRLSDEPVGKYEPESVPASNQDEIAPMGTIAGYGLARIFIDQLGTGKSLPKREVQDRLVRGLSVLDGAIHEADTPLELLAVLAEGLTTEGDVEPSQACKAILSQGWLEEHNTHSMLDEFKTVLADKAPELWQTYSTFSPEQKVELKLA